MAVQEDFTEDGHEILVHGNRDEEPVVSIVLEGSKVLCKCENTAKACAPPDGTDLCFKSTVSLKLKYTFEVFQKLFLELDGLKLSPKVRSLKTSCLLDMFHTLDVLRHLSALLTHLFCFEIKLETVPLRKSVPSYIQNVHYVYPSIYICISCSTILMLYYNRVDNVGYPHLIKLLFDKIFNSLQISEFLFQVFG